MGNIPYLIIPLLLAWVLRTPAKGAKKRDSIATLTVSFFVFLYLSFFNYDAVPDVEKYNTIFMLLTTKPIAELESYDPTYMMEPSWLLYNKVLAFFIGNPRIIYIVRAIISLCILGRVLKKHSVNVYISIVVYMLFAGGVMQSIYVIRQYLAAMIFLLSIDAILEKKLKKYLLICLLAMSFHVSIIVLIPLYFIYHYFKFEKWNRYVLFFIVLVASLFSNRIIYYVMNNYGLLQAYADIVSVDEGGGGIGNAVRYAAFLFLFLSLNKKIWVSSYGRLYLSVLFLATFFGVGIIGIPSGSRLMIVYNIFYMLIIPFIYVSIKIIPLKRIYALMVVLLIAFMQYKDLVNVNYHQFYFMWEDAKIIT